MSVPSAGKSRKIRLARGPGRGTSGFRSGPTPQGMRCSTNSRGIWIAMSLAIASGSLKWADLPKQDVIAPGTRNELEQDGMVLNILWTVPKKFLESIRQITLRSTLFQTSPLFVELEGSNIKALCQDLARQLSSIANNWSRSCWQTSKFLCSDHISGQHDGAKTANPALVISRPSEDVQRGPNMQLSRGVHKTPSGDPAKQVKNHQSLAQVLKSSNFLSLLLGPVDSQAFLLPSPIGLPIRHASSQAAISKGTARHVVSGKSRHVPIIHNETLRNSWEYSETESNFIRIFDEFQ
ncbi:hypothetical protein DFH07DRAFT_766466 [Mycena maculata]|uniref:Uncharacterized protein n=1 Tax=Mycena maculata TaxID=230809 RepID=A0AAD7K236_9AGAR|nr:hypothetical protein DFH07DRAFT_766466 [Mycena maculata]